MSDRKLWHYTVGIALPAILESGELRLATCFVQAGVKPVVWCSYNQVWEATASKSVINAVGQMRALNRDETHELAGGLVRIEVDPAAAPLDWRAYKRESGDKPQMLKSLYEVAIERRMRPGDWRCSFTAIRREQWPSIEKWNGEAWEPATFKVSGAAARDLGTSPNVAKLTALLLAGRRGTYRIGDYVVSL